MKTHFHYIHIKGKEYITGPGIKGGTRKHYHKVNDEITSTDPDGGTHGHKFRGLKMSYPMYVEKS